MNSGWPPLTVALSDRRSPVRQLLDRRFPHVRDLQRRYREMVGPLAIDGSGDVNYGTLGGAFDWLVRFLISPQPDVHLAQRGAALSGSPELMRLHLELVGLLNLPVNRTAATVGLQSAFQGPFRGSNVEPDLLARGCWALALFTEVFRAGLHPGSQLLTIDSRNARIDELLLLAPDSALRQLHALRGAAETTLLPFLSTRRGSWAVGPTFDGSVLMNADADLVAAGLLLEIKTSLGRKREDGTRNATLDKQAILQLLGYTLLDFSDRYEITELGLYSARYAHIATWKLSNLLRELAGRPIDLAAERARFRNLLLEGPPRVD